MKSTEKLTSNEINSKYAKEITEYFKDNAKKLYALVDKVLFNLKFHDIDVEDFYSLSHEIFYNSLSYYDESQSFNAFLYSCLYKKFCTYMTAKKRSKRCMKIKVKEIDENGNVIEKVKFLDDERLDRPIGASDDSLTLGEVVPSKESIDSEFFSEREDGFSYEMTAYLSRLSNMQKEVLQLLSIGFIAKDIIEELHITQKQYDDCYNAIHSYRNVSILM